MPQTTQDQAPADAVERAARALWEDACQEFEYAWEPNAESFRALARTVLAAAMPTTTTEWAIRWPDGTLDDRDDDFQPFTEASAREYQSECAEGTAVVSREFTEWREVTP